MAEIELKRRVKYAGDVHSELLKAGWDCCTAAEFLNNIPDADIVSVRHGRWLDGRCTVCGWEEPDVCTWMGYDSEAWIETPYCPNCGAIMRGDRL